MDTQDTPILDLGSIDFTPDWAKKAAGVSSGRITPEREDRRQVRQEATKAPRRNFDAKASFARSGAQNRSSAPHRFDRSRPLDAEIKVLPETKALGTIMRKLQQSAQAFKLKDLAYFLLDNPETVLLKITPKAPQGGEGEKLTFHQCRACSFAAQSRDEVVAHVLASHLGDYYEAKEIEVEPPKGNFNCVAKCGLTGVLLGPPNVHEFNSIIRDMIGTKFPNMSEAEYRAKIEMVRDPEVVEEWRKSCTKRTVFVAKGAGEDAPKLSREQAEGEFRRNMLDSVVTEPKNLMMTADVAMKSPVRSLAFAAKEALAAERRSPYNMIFALRGAFHHRKMKFFRANDARGPEFVIAHELKTLDMAHAVPELAKVAQFLAEHPCSSKQEIVALGDDAEKQLAWLVTTGHAVSFTNGVFSAVEKYPKYGPQWRNKKAKNPPKQEERAEDAAAAPAAAPEPANAAEGATEEKKEQDETAVKLAE